MENKTLLDNFVAEANRQSKILGSQYYIEVVPTRSLLNLMRRDSSLSYPAYYKSIYARVDPVTLDVYTANGKMIRGNLHNAYGGFDLINSEGVITVACKKESRLKELQSTR